MPSPVAKKIAPSPASPVAIPPRPLPPLDVVLARLRTISPAVRALNSSSWLLFLALYARIATEGKAISPTQVELQTTTALSTRTIRRAMQSLLAGEILKIRHFRSKKGSSHIVYALGDVTHVALDELRARRTKKTPMPLRKDDTRVLDLEQRIAALERRDAATAQTPSNDRREEPAARALSAR
jgi:hypothetical protein